MKFNNRKIVHISSIHIETRIKPDQLTAWNMVC